MPKNQQSVLMILTKTRFGRYACLVDSNQEASRLSEIKGIRIKIMDYVLAVLLAGLVAGCETIKDYSLTGNLWHKDPTASLADSVEGRDYLYGRLARVTLTPFTVAVDATVIAAAIGAGCAVASFADACQEGARNGGRVCY